MEKRYDNSFLEIYSQKNDPGCISGSCKYGNSNIDPKVSMATWLQGESLLFSPAENGSQLVCGSTLSQANNRVVVQSGRSLL